MPRVPKSIPLSKRLLSGLIAGIIVGMVFGFGHAFRLTQVSYTLVTPFQKGQFQLHLTVIYGLLMLIPGLIIGALALGRRRDINLLANGIIILASLLLFYAGRNRLSTKFWMNFAETRWLLEIIGFLGWGLICWIIYKFLIFVEKRIRGMTLGVSLVAIAFTVLWIVPPVLKSPYGAQLAADDPILPAPNDSIKVALIGIDGAWWEFADPMMESGQLPNFQHLVTNGCRAHLRTISPNFSPGIWNTITTGKMPDKHGIGCFLTLTFPITGVTIPQIYPPKAMPELLWMKEHIFGLSLVSADKRITSTLWDILSLSGATVGVISWWGSYPVDPLNGYIVSDQALYNRYLSQSPEEVENVEHYSVFPQELFSELQPLSLNPEDVTIETASRFIHIETDEDRNWYQNAGDLRFPGKNRGAAIFKCSYLEDITTIQAAMYLLENYNQPDFFAMCLKGLDAVQHQYLPYYYHHHHTDILNPDDIRRLKDAVPEYYRFMDEVLGQILTALDPNTIVIVLSDHGFDKKIVLDCMYHHFDAPPGVFIVTGPGIKQNAVIENIGVEDITPTILSLFELPVGKDMDGRAVTEIYQKESDPVTWVETYDSQILKTHKTKSSQLGEVAVDQLKALGYVK